MKNNKSVLVTLANKDYINQAKQLFSSVYWNSGWKGDYLLLAHEIPEKELDWFRKKGILIRKCKPIEVKKIGFKSHSLVVLDKLYVFKKEFKKWDKVIFLDSDIIVRNSLDRLLDVKGFGAIRAPRWRFGDLFINTNSENYKFLRKNFNFRKREFNTGVFTFNTEIIKEKTFQELLGLLYKFSPEISLADESILNIYFYDNHKKIHPCYNFLPSYLSKRGYKWNKEVKIILFHFFFKMKPWDEKSSFYEEWKSNLKKAELIDLEHRPIKKELTKKELSEIIHFVNIRIFKIYLIIVLHCRLGKIGKFLLKKSPRTYYCLKKRILKTPLLNHFLYPEIKSEHREAN